MNWNNFCFPQMCYAKWCEAHGITLWLKTWLREEQGWWENLAANEMERKWRACQDCLRVSSEVWLVLKSFFFYAFCTNQCMTNIPGGFAVYLISVNVKILHLFIWNGNMLVLLESLHWKTALTLKSGFLFFCTFVLRVCWDSLILLPSTHTQLSWTGN